MTEGSHRAFFRPALAPDQEEWAARIRNIAPVLEEHRESAERDRVIPPSVFRALRESGATRLWVGEEFGGERASIRAGSTAIRELARIDASVAWQVGVQGAIGRLSDYLPEATARKLFKDHSGFVVGGVNPAGRAEAVDGGYRVTGEWGFASGSAHADWLVCCAFVTRDGERVGTPAGPETRMLFLPRAQAEIKDTWHTLGLRGTGSNHFAVHDAFVPGDFTVPGADLLGPPAPRPSRAYPIGYYDFGPFTSASTALGIARDALDSLYALVHAKVPAAGTKTLAESHTLQEKLARAEMRVHTARVLLDDAAHCAQEYGESGGDRLSALIRATAATVAENVVEAVTTAYTLAGTTSLYTVGRLERCLRDVHSATKHITLSATHFEMTGRYLLGGELAMRR